MKVIVPMAGRGSRFKNTQKPKPLIDVLGKSMIEWTLGSILYSLPQIRARDCIFIVLKEHRAHHLFEHIESLIGKGSTLVELEDVTEGPVCTVLTAMRALGLDEDFVSVDCDQYFRCPSLRDMIAQAKQEHWSGLIPVYESDNPAYSYVKLDTRGNVLKTAEKEVISNLAAAGIYYFGSRQVFEQAAHAMIDRKSKTKNEYYMCPLYNEVIAQGGVVKTVSVAEWMTIGTPEDMKRFIDAKQK